MEGDRGDKCVDKQFTHLIACHEQSFWDGRAGSRLERAFGKVPSSGPLPLTVVAQVGSGFYFSHTCCQGAGGGREKRL